MALQASQQQDKFRVPFGAPPGSAMASLLEDQAQARGMPRFPPTYQPQAPQSTFNSAATTTNPPEQGSQLTNLLTTLVTTLQDNHAKDDIRRKGEQAIGQLAIPGRLATAPPILRRTHLFLTCQKMIKETYNDPTSALKFGEFWRDSIETQPTQYNWEKFLEGWKKAEIVRQENLFNNLIT
jgi:hypothetical protein